MSARHRFPKSPANAVHSFEWDNCWLGEEQRRRRRFSFGVRGTEPIDLRRWMPQAAPIRAKAVVADARDVPVKLGGSGKVRTTHPAVTQASVNNSAEAKGRVQEATVTRRKGVQAKTVTAMQGGASVRTDDRRVCTAR